jgi:hypothetical protein
LLSRPPSLEQTTATQLTRERMGRAAQGQKSGGGEGGHGLSRAEAEIRSVRVLKGARGGSELASLIPFREHHT